MRSFAAALSTANDPAHAVAEACDEVRERLGGPADLACVFVSAEHGLAAATVGPAVRELLDAGTLVGAVCANGVLADGREVEDGRAVAGWAAHLPDVELKPVALLLTEV